MKNFFSQLKKKLSAPSDDEILDIEEEYVELDSSPQRHDDTKVVVRPFVIEDFSDVKEILDSLRNGSTIALVNIKPLKEKDIIELKRAINKLKKTTDAIKGDVAGFGDDYIVIVPEFAEIYRSRPGAKAPSGSDSSDDFE
ncbi:MAG TPA: cell division protein SepF [Acidobacteriota bacterium]|nr:cell division protein SepF [Acidobacteriota bacterium]